MAQELEQIEKFCTILPPTFSNLVDVLVNLPILLLYLITLPVRFFICFLAQTFHISPLCVLFNLFPFISIICPIILGEQNPVSCYGNCKYCQTNECIKPPQSLVTLCQCPYSIFNKIFCDIGVVIGSIIAPFTALINVFLVPILHQQICLSVDAQACYG